MSKSSKKYRIKQRVANEPTANKARYRKSRNPVSPSKPGDRPQRRERAKHMGSSVSDAKANAQSKAKSSAKLNAQSPTAVSHRKTPPSTVEDLLQVGSGQAVRHDGDDENETEINGPFLVDEELGLRQHDGNRTQYLCRAFSVLGEVVDNDGTSPAYLVRFRNRLDQAVFAEIPLAIVQQPKALFAWITQTGLADDFSSPEARGKSLRAYLILNCPVDTVRVRVHQDGLETLPGGAERYLLDGEVFGGGGEYERYEAYAVRGKSNVSPAHPSVSATQAARQPQKAAREAWHALSKALRNDFLAVLVICAAFAAVLLKHTQQSSKALFLIGSSSIGKTILLRLVNALFSRTATLFTWDGTENGIEANLAQHRDRSLVLDEVGQSSGKQLSGLAYRLMNGSGRQRADSSGKARAIAMTRSIIVSSGELSPFDLMRHARQTIHRGQEARLLVLPANEPHGVWSTLGDFASGAAKSAWVEAQLDYFRGMPAREFLTQVVSKLPALAEEFRAASAQLAADIAIGIALDPDDNIQGRVLQSFALFAFAGRVAVRAGVVRWEEKHVVSAVRHGFGLWHAEYRRNQPVNDQTLLQAVRVFLQSERGNRIKPFDAWAENHGDTVAGYEYVARNGDKAFLLYPAYFEKYLCATYLPSQVLTALRNANLLMPGSRGVPSRQVHLPGTDNQRRSFYAIRKSILTS